MRAARRHRQLVLVVVVIFQDGVIDHELVIQPDADPRADHDDAQLIPLAERLVGQHQRVFAGRAGAVVPQPAGAFVGAEVELRFLGVIPDLHLRAAAQIDAGVAQRHGLVLDEQLEVAVVLLGGGVIALAVVDQLAVLHAPMLASWCRSTGRSCAARSASVMAASLRGSKVEPPRQPVRSLPLKSAVNRGGRLIQSPAEARERAERASAARERREGRRFMGGESVKPGERAFLVGGRGERLHEGGEALRRDRAPGPTPPRA